MDPQNQTTLSTPTNNQPTNTETTPATQASNSGIQVTAGSDGVATGVDLSQLFKDGEPGVYDPDKLTALMKDRDNKAKSASYFQSQFMQKNEVPETIDGYAEHFKADSIYEKFMDNPEVQARIKQLREFGLQQKISPRALNAFIDFDLKEMVENGYLDNRTPEEIKEAEAKATAEEAKKLEPFLATTGRTFEQQTELINKFFETPSVFTNDPEIKEFFQKAATESAVAYKAISYLIDAIEFGGYKALPTQGDSLGVGQAEFWNKYNAETDPVKRDAMLTEYEKMNPGSTNK